MKRSLFLLIMMLPVMGFTQAEKKLRRLSSVGIVVAPDYSYRYLNYSSSQRWVAEMRDDDEVGNFGFTVGMQAHYRLRDRLKFETGLLYTNKGLQTKYEDLAWTSINIDFPTRSKTIYRFKYLQLPVGISYTLCAAEKLRWFVKAGLSVDFFLAKKTKVVTDYADRDESSRSSSKQVGYSRFGLSTMIGAGLDYRFTKRLTFRGEPFFQRSLTSIVRDKHAREYLFSFGIATSIHYSF
jgi:hypothetical protein